MIRLGTKKYRTLKLLNEAENGLTQGGIRTELNAPFSTPFNLLTLERQGYISSDWVTGPSPRKRLYKLTLRGQQALEQIDN